MRFFLIAIVLLIGTSAFAEPTSISTACAPLPEQEGSHLLHQLQSHYRQIHALRADFTQQSYLKSLDLKEESKGQVTVEIPGKLYWKYVEPEPQVFLLRDKKFELYQPMEQQLIIQDATQYFLSDIPVSFLLGLGDVTKDFQVGKGCKDGKSVHLVLIPKKKSGVEKSGVSRALQQLSLSFKEGEFLPLVTEVEDAEGNRTGISLSHIEINPALSADTFTLVPPKGTDIQDLR